MSLNEQLSWLFILAMPIACIAWTVTHEEVFREPREFCVRKSQSCERLYQRKFFYLFTCEYCFSHYIAAFILVLSNYKLLINDWRGYVLAFFALIWVANIYMSLYAYVRTDLKKERLLAKKEEKSLEE